MLLKRLTSTNAALIFTLGTLTIAHTLCTKSSTLALWLTPLFVVLGIGQLILTYLLIERGEI